MRQRSRSHGLLPEIIARQGKDGPAQAGDHATCYQEFGAHFLAPSMSDMSEAEGRSNQQRQIDNGTYQWPKLCADSDWWQLAQRHYVRQDQ